MDHRTIVSFFTCQLVWVNRYLNVTCHETSGDWVMEQYLLRITTPFNGTAFQAELLDYAEGANIYRDEPRQRYPLTFIKQS